GFLIPRGPGILSARGRGGPEVPGERRVTGITRVDGTTPAEVDAIFIEIETATLEDLMREQFPRERLLTRRHAGMRYRGQSYEVAVPVAPPRGPPGLGDPVTPVSCPPHPRHRPKAPAQGRRIRPFPV